MITERQNSITRATYKKASALRITWVIAWRQIIEAVRDRSMLVMTGFSIGLPLVILFFILSSAQQGPRAASSVGSTIEFFLLWIGVTTTTPAVGIASGVFAGDKERGCLTPLLATPASNVSIFAGKVLGAVVPALGISATGILACFGEIALFFGPEKLRFLPLGLTVMILLLIPAVSFFAAGLASVISSRVHTFQAAQTYSSFILVFLWFGLIALLFLASTWGLWAFAAAVAAIYVVDVLLIVLSAVTWRREEVMARQ
jgi:ABC-type Na+ efflux pump permease subunit